MILTYTQREAIRYLAHNLTPTTLAAIVAELSDSEDWSLKATATICGIVGIANCGEDEFTELVFTAQAANEPDYYTGSEDDDIFQSGLSHLAGPVGR